MSVANYEITDVNALNWCNTLHNEGVELKMTWDGGGDSGWVNFEIDRENMTDEDHEYVEYLRNKCYEELDYGSWAGEFYANGEAIFNPEEKAFVGVDNYSEDDTINAECSIRVAVPGDLWFDSIEIMVEDEEVIVTTDIIVRNGFKTPAHKEAELAISESVREQVLEVINEVTGNENEYRGMWEEISLQKSEFEEDGNQMVHIIEEIGVGTFNEEDKDIFIPLNDEE